MIYGIGPYAGFAWASYVAPSRSHLLAANTGTYILSGVGAAFAVSEPASAGSCSVVGVSATFGDSQATAGGPYALTGHSVSFGVGFATASGAYVLTCAAQSFLVKEPADRKSVV